MTNQTSDNNKRIAKNTLLLYVRMFFMMGIALYTSRVVGHSSRGIIPRLIGHWCSRCIRRSGCYVFLMPLPLFVWNILVLMLLALILTTNSMRISRTLLLLTVCFPTYSLRKTCCQCRLLALTLSARNCAMP